MQSFHSFTKWVSIFTKCNVWSHFWSRCSSPLFSVLWRWLFIRPVSRLLICLHVHKVKILHFLRVKKVHNTSFDSSSIQNGPTEWRMLLSWHELPYCIFFIYFFNKQTKQSENKYLKNVIIDTIHDAHTRATDESDCETSCKE